MADRDQSGSLMRTLAAIAVVVTALYLAKGVLVPLTLGLLLSFLLSPVCDWLERRGLSRLPAVFATVFVGFMVLGAVTWTAVVQMSELAPRVPEYQKNFLLKVHTINNSLTAALNKFTQTSAELAQDFPTTADAEKPLRSADESYAVHVIPTSPSPWQILSGTFGTILEAFGSTGLVLMLVVFFLIRREDLRDRFVHLVGRGHLTVTTQTLEDAATRVSRYLATQFVVNLSFGIAVGVGLYFIKVPNAVLWGIAATVLRFVPYVGALIAAAMPIGLSMAISTGWIAPLLTVGLFLGLDLVVANFLEPWLYGKHTGVSAVAVLVAAVFWTWLWGAIGLLLATPLTVCLLVLGKHVPQFSFFNILLGNEPVFDLQTRVYQRLLAGDQEEATELVEAALAKSSLSEVFDTVLIPALALAERDRRRGDIDEDRQKFIFQSLKDTIDDLGERSRGESIPPVGGGKNANNNAAVAVVPMTSSQPCVLLLPARNSADEIAATMLEKLVATTGCRVETISTTVLVGELANLISERQADVVCISAMPPAAATHARYLCRRLQGKFPGERLLVGLWSAQGDLSKAKSLVGCEPSVRLVATLVKAHELIEAIVWQRLRRESAPDVATEIGTSLLEPAHS